MTASNRLSQQLLRHVFPGLTGDLAHSVTHVPDVYVALLSAAPVGDVYTEVSYTSYARVSTSSGDWEDATLADPSVVTNKTAVTFPTASGGSSTATHWAIMTGATAVSNDMLGWASLVSSLAISNGIQPQFAIGALQMQAT